MVGQGLDYIWLIGYLADSCLRNRVAGKALVGFAQGVEMGPKKTWNSKRDSNHHTKTLF